MNMLVRNTHPQFDLSMELLCLLQPGADVNIAALCTDLGGHATPTTVRRLVDTLNTRFVTFGESSLVLVAARSGFVTLVKAKERPDYRKMMDAAQEYYETVYSLDAVKKSASATTPTRTKVKRAG